MTLEDASVDQVPNHGSIRLPKALDYRHLGELFRVCEQVRSTTGTIVLDGQDVEFIDPLGIAVLGALLEPLAAQHTIRLEWLRAEIGSYLDRMDVLERCSIEGVEVRPYVPNDRRHSLVELTRLCSANEVDEAAERLASAIIGPIVDSPDDVSRYAYPLQYSLGELLLNALTHAKKEGRAQASVWVAAQYYTKTGVVRVAVVDNGCGPFATLQHSPKLAEKSHVGAILAALEPFVTCNPDTGAALVGETTNRGIGLTTTRRIATAANGKLVITSGNATVTADRSAHPMELPEGACWNGTAILMTCQRSKLPSVNVQQLFPQVPGLPTVKPLFVD